MIGWLGKVKYYQMIKKLFGASLIGYWPLWDASGSVATDVSGNGRNGVYTNVTQCVAGVGDGRTGISMSTGRVNLYSASLAGAFNGDEGFFSCWFYLSSWAGTTCMLAYIVADETNNYILLKQTAANTISVWRNSGGTAAQYFVKCNLVNQWVQIGIEWSKTGNFVRVICNGAQYGADSANVGTWSGALSSNKTVIGSRYSDSQNSSFVGSIAHVMLGNVAPTLAQWWLIAQPYIHPAGSVLLDFDGPYAYIYTDLFPLMAARGLVGTNSVVSDWMGTGSYMTWAQMLALQTAGWAIKNETVDHTNLTTLTQAQIEAEVTNCKLAMIANGVSSAGRHLTYPSGGVNATVRTAMGTQGILTGRLNATARNAMPKTDALTDIPSQAPTWGTTPLGDIINMCKSAWVMNQVCNLKCSMPGLTPYADFATVLNTLVSFGIPVITILQYYALATA